MTPRSLLQIEITHIIHAIQQEKKHGKTAFYPLLVKDTHQALNDIQAHIEAITAGIEAINSQDKTALNKLKTWLNSQLMDAQAKQDYIHKGFYDRGKE